jgi:hypothetical protein
MRFFKRLLIAASVAAAPSVTAYGAQVLVDFGDAATPTSTADSLGRSWNNITPANDTAANFILNNAGGTDSGYRLSISNPPGTTNAVGFNSANTNGTTAPTGAAASHGYPSSATRDSLYGNMVSFNGLVVEAVRLTLSNLNPSELYNFDFFASRTGAGGDNRETEYHVTGGNANTSVFLNASENTGNIASLTGVSPDGSNQIVIDVDPGPNNNNANRFFYLGVLEVNSTPEPSSILLLGIVPAAGLLRRRRVKG